MSSIVKSLGEYFACVRVLAVEGRVIHKQRGGMPRRCVAGKIFSLPLDKPRGLCYNTARCHPRCAGNVRLAEKKKN